ncbi:hypothetical protein RCCS2_00507 [Roseobacter sp. CCS2]|nr:hypothetical protein RCCS2_00507 [Roseobacter sp. CCS2]
MLSFDKEYLRRPTVHHPTLAIYIDLMLSSEICQNLFF